MMVGLFRTFDYTAVKKAGLRMFVSLITVSVSIWYVQDFDVRMSSG